MLSLHILIFYTLFGPLYLQFFKGDFLHLVLQVLLCFSNLTLFF